jgi:hypothetical protein
MKTPWLDIEVSDAHVHFFSPPFFQALAEQKGGGDAGAKAVRSMLAWDMPESSEDLADRWADELDRNAVKSAVVIGSIPGDVESVGVAVERYPERFRSIVMLNPLSHGADTRCSNALAEGQIHGIFLFPAMHRFSMHDPKVHSLLSIVAGYPGTVVYVHCGMLSVGFRKKLGLPSAFDMRYSNPIDLHAVAITLPNLPFVIPHFGAGYLREALMLADLCPNIYFDTSSSNSWMRCDPAMPNLTALFRAVLNVVGPRRLLFGTDSSWFPRGWMRTIFDAQVQAMHEAGVDDAGARAILGGNLRGLFQKS